MKDGTAESRRVWDLPTRVFHWTLALSFCGAYVLGESDELRQFHIMFGYTVLALIAFRLVWGFLGTRYARFSSFARGPSAVGAHLRALAHRKSEPHPGHTPAGGWAILLMLVLAAVTAATGWLHANAIGGEALEELHELAANTWLVLVFIHIAGVIVSSLVERQNLVRAMLSGYKQVSSAQMSVRNLTLLGVLMLTGVIAFWTATLVTGGAGLMPGAMQAEASSPEAHLRSHDHEDAD